jgi:hypothetical protein
VAALLRSQHDEAALALWPTVVTPCGRTIHAIGTSQTSTD